MIFLFKKINLRNNDFKAAHQSLEYGLSYNFQIKNHPIYHLIRARIFKQQGNIQEALKTLQLAMQLPGVKKPCKLLKDKTLAYKKFKLYSKKKFIFINFLLLFNRYIFKLVRKWTCHKVKKQ